MLKVYSKKVAIFSIFVLLIILVTSCTDFFSSRDPEDPENNQNVTYATSITELVNNFKESFREKKVYTYETLFSDSLQGGQVYVFESRAVDVINHEIFNDWSIDNELDFLETFLADKRFTQFELTHDEINETLEDSSTFEFDYNLLLTDDLEYEERLMGHSIFKLIRVNNIWMIKKWIDEFDGSDDIVSISKIKVPFSE
jgi:hypothetical protein